MRLALQAAQLPSFFLKLCACRHMHAPTLRCLGEVAPVLLRHAAQLYASPSALSLSCTQVMHAPALQCLGERLRSYGIQPSCMIPLLALSLACMQVHARAGFAATGGRWRLCCCGLQFDCMLPLRCCSEHACRYMLEPSLRRLEKVALVLFRHAAQLLAFPLRFDFKRACRHMHTFKLCILSVGAA